MILLEHLSMDDRIKITIDGNIVISCTYELDVANGNFQVCDIDKVLIHGETMAYPFGENHSYLLRNHCIELDCAALAKSQELAEREKKEAGADKYLDKIERSGG